MKRAVDIGPVDAAAIKIGAGKVRLRLLFTTEQLEALLLAAKDGDVESAEACHAESRTVTQSHARGEEIQRREEDDGGGDARARPPPQNPGPGTFFVIEGTRAWDAWMTYRQKVLRKPQCPRTTHIVEGKSRGGWWFATLFPPAEEATGPPADDERGD